MLSKQTAHINSLINKDKGLKNFINIKLLFRAMNFWRNNNIDMDNACQSLFIQNFQIMSCTYFKWWLPIMKVYNIRENIDIQSLMIQFVEYLPEASTSLKTFAIFSPQLWL